MSRCVVKHANGTTSTIDGAIYISETLSNVAVWWSAGEWCHGSSFDKKKVESIEVTFKECVNVCHATEEK